MAQVIVRGLDESVVKRLSRRARHGGRSLEEEARNILTDESRMPAPGDFRKRLGRIHRMLAGRRFGDSTALIREDRER